MSTDRELLEMAAKAAGIEMSGTLYRDGTWEPGISHSFKPAGGIGAGIDVTSWNPLEDDGDALRLAVKLGMSFGFVLETGGMAHWGPVTYTQARQQIDDLQCGRGFSGPMETHGEDPYAATRRAIVRAAAEIGRNMK